MIIMGELARLPQHGFRAGVNEGIPSANYGAVAEALAVAELLRHGHEVAVPVVDNGIDLCVDYWARVQVKGAHRLTFEPREGFAYDRFQWSRLWGSDSERCRIDFFVLYGRDGERDRWWIVPASVVRSVAGSLNFLPNAVRGLSLEIAKYEDAWDALRR